MKAWGEPLLTAKGRFAYDQDIRASQFAAAQLSDDYRLEIVGNLDAYLAGTGPYERLTLSADEIRNAPCHASMTSVLRACKSGYAPSISRHAMLNRTVLVENRLGPAKGVPNP